MMKSKLKSPLPSLRGRVKEINRKVIILFITIVLSLSALLMPYSLSSTIAYTPTYAAANVVEEQSAVENREEGIMSVVNKHIEELKEQGYINPSWEWNIIAQQVGVNFTVEELSEDNYEKAVLKNFDFYAEYIELAENDKLVYYFKTNEESESFIEDINKYEKTEYEKKESVKKVIGTETPQEDLDAAVNTKKVIAEKKEAQRKAAIEAQKRAAAAANNYVNDTTPVSDNEIVNFALQFKGNPYVYGGTSLTNGADCSGFVQSVYKHFGISLPRTASAQASAGYAVSFSNLQPGDLVFYSGDGGYSISHVAIYIGNSQIIHASTPSGGIKVSSVNIMTKMTARRVI